MTVMGDPIVGYYRIKKLPFQCRSLHNVRCNRRILIIIPDQFPEKKSPNLHYVLLTFNMDPKIYIFLKNLKRFLNFIVLDKKTTVKQSLLFLQENLQLFYVASRLGTTSK